MTDDIPQVLMDLAGINSKWTIPIRSLLNENYDSSRHRLVANGRYDYDQICK